MKYKRWSGLLVGAMCLIGGCAGVDSGQIAGEAGCKALVAHIVSLELNARSGSGSALPAAELEAHRAAREHALARELLPTCHDDYSTADIECGLQAGTRQGVFACISAREGK